MRRFVRFVICFTLLMSSTHYSINVFAADSEAAAEKSSSDTATAEKQKKENIFASASDAQIKEAQRYYKKCRDNKTLSAQKDCKCSATKFLKTRMTLGKEAKLTDIVKANINTCLKDPKKARISSKAKTDISNVTQKQMDEANFVYEFCSASSDYSRHYDCECYAANLLEQRILQGPLPNWKTLTLTFEGRCPNLVDQTGTEYSMCLSTPQLVKPAHIEQDKYCECYAQQWAKSLQRHEGRINIHVKQAFRKKSIMYCTTPGAYK